MGELPCSTTSRDAEDYLLWMISDSNLPTASAGLESFYAHGFLTETHGAGKTSAERTVDQTVIFVECSLKNYVKSTLPYLHAAFTVTQKLAHDPQCALRALAWLDTQVHTLMLNHVSRRASLIQGSALLSLYSKSFARKDHSASQLVDSIRLQARRGSARLNAGALALCPLHGELVGHLPICTGAVAASLDLSLERTLRHNLFIQARNIMSCSIRLNTIGPYMAHQLLAFQLRQIVEKGMQELDYDVCDNLHMLAVNFSEQEQDDHKISVTTDFDWDWKDHSKTAPIPHTTWPLGEIVQARHDQLHSRLFNS